jgi:hypothetical protein
MLINHENGFLNADLFHEELAVYPEVLQAGAERGLVVSVETRDLAASNHYILPSMSGVPLFAMCFENLKVGF